MMRMDINTLISGMVVGRDIILDDVLLVKKGQELTPHLIHRLKGYGITYVDIVSDKEKAKQDYVINEDVYDKIVETIKSNDPEEIKSAANEIVGSVLKSIETYGDFSNLKYDIEKLSNTNEFDKSIRISIFSVILAYLYNKQIKKQLIKEEDLINLNDITTACLTVHKGRNIYKQDAIEHIREMKKDKDLVKLMPGLKDVSLENYHDKFISLYSYSLIHKMPGFTKETKKMVLFSSENENRTGPLQVHPDNVISGAKIIRLCTLFDDILAHCYDANESFENVITVLGQAVNSKMINEELAVLFLKNVPLYPIGARVMLSNGEEATVIKTFPGYTYSTRPMVRLISNNEVVDLRQARDITISYTSVEDQTLEHVIDGQVEGVKNRR